MRSVAAVVLAAGGSTRLGRPKQLVEFDGSTLLARTIAAAGGAGCDRVVVVVGDATSDIDAEVAATGATIVHNHDWQRGLGTSIRSGIRHLADTAPDIDAAVLLACDQPYVDSDTIGELIKRYRSGGNSVVASNYSGTVGIPALFDRLCFGSLLALPDDSGAKSFIESRGADVELVRFEKGAIDIDTPAEAERLKKLR